VPEKAASLEQLELAADACIADRLRTLMANAVFRSLEGCWRGLHWLITRLEPEDRFEAWIIDADRTGLADDLTGCGLAFEESRLFRTLEGIAGERPVSDFLDLIVVLDTIGGSVDDVGYLARLVDFADHCGVTCVAEAHPALVGASSVEALAEPRDWQRNEALTRAWEALRSRSAASRLGLVVPGFLLRLPYGRDADPIDRLEFEEVPGTPEHDRFLWGNGALAFALLYCRGSVGAQDTVVEDLPAYVYRSDDGRRLMPCNGVLLGERAAQAIGALGIMPLVWPRSSNMLQLATRQSIGNA
jgi:type VI secretion system protein ImpC